MWRMKEETIAWGKDLGIAIKDIEIVLRKITGLSTSQLFLAQEISEEHIGEVRESFARLSRGEPIQYVVSSAEFMGKEFFVDERVLIPRDDTEVLVKTVLQTSPPIPFPQGEGSIVLIDVGTGSGIIPITLMWNMEPQISNCYAIDVSREALEVATVNVKKYGLQDKIQLLEGDLLAPFLRPRPNPLLHGGEVPANMVITANLPYIKQDDFENMDTSVYTHEPRLALYGWPETGFELYERLILQCLQLQKSSKRSTLFIEIGFDQFDIAIAYIKSQGLTFDYFRDTHNIVRVIQINFS